MQRLNVDVEKVLRFKILSRLSCVWCTRAKMLLNKHEIPFEELNVEEDSEAMEFLQDRMRRTKTNEEFMETMSQ